MPTVPERSMRRAELLGLMAFALSLMLLVSLATFHPGDPAPFFKAGGTESTRNFIGPFGAFLAELLIAQLLGTAAFLVPLVLGLLGWKLFWCRPIEAPYTKGLGTTVLLFALTAFVALLFGTVAFDGEPVRAGGAIGEALSALLVVRFGRAGAFIVASTGLFVGLIVSTQLSIATALASLSRRIAERFRGVRTSWAHWRENRRKELMRREVVRKHAQQKETVPPEAGERPRKARAQSREDALDLEDLPGGGDERALGQRPLPLIASPRSAPEPSLALDEETPARTARRAARRAAAPAEGRGQSVLPPSSLLDDLSSAFAPDHARLYERGRTLQSKCEEFGVLGTVKEIHPGPVVTTYEFKPDAGVKYSKIVGLSDDLALALEAESIRIDRISGKGTVGIEIPNPVRETIALREIIDSDSFRKAHGRLTLALGKTVGGDTYVTDLGAMPHLLIAGATGQGKSVGLNCMIASILFKSTPDDVRLILIDPKHLELGVYEDIPHLLTPVVTDPKVAANVLRWAVGEMERRIRTLASEGVRNIEQFNNIIRAERRPGAEGEDDPLKPLHYIVIVIDELADLMMISSSEVEEAITRLAQMARAVGIHLILATQRPSVDVLTGLIKANFPSRISFRVSARVDSRTILDAIGAERLLGKGDMLFLPPGSARLVRLHGAYVSEQEISRLTGFLRKVGTPAYDDSVGKPEKSPEALEALDRDELFDDAVRFVVQSGQASTSMLQRRFRIGFSRAGRLIDVMEQDGIIGPADGSKAREIKVASDYYEAVDHWPK